MSFILLSSYSLFLSLLPHSFMDISKHLKTKQYVMGTFFFCILGSDGVYKIKSSILKMEATGSSEIGMYLPNYTA
jgi:hypothetical protein